MFYNWIKVPHVLQCIIPMIGYELKVRLTLVVFFIMGDGQCH